MNVLRADGCPVAVLRPANGELALSRMRQQLGMRGDDAQRVLAVMLAEQEWTFVGWIGVDKRSLLREDDEAVIYELITDAERAIPRQLIESGLAMHLVDGDYGSAQHSWIGLVHGGARGILDCYAVGRLPPVQLVHDTMGLARMYRADACGALRADIRRGDVAELVQLVTRRLYVPGQEKREDANPCACSHAFGLHTAHVAHASSFTGCTVAGCPCVHWRSPRAPI
jgi:hypothetical protein